MPCRGHDLRPSPNPQKKTPNKISILCTPHTPHSPLWPENGVGARARSVQKGGERYVRKGGEPTSITYSGMYPRASQKKGGSDPHD